MWLALFLESLQPRSDQRMKGKGNDPVGLLPPEAQTGI